jgi:hypothetical protein
MTGLYRIAAERRPGITTAGAEEQLATLIVLLSDLVETAVRAAFEIVENHQTNRGGKRRAGPTAEVHLIQSIIEAYAELRERFPDSGPQPAFDKSLKTFVRLGLKLAVTSTIFFDSNGKRYQRADITAVDPKLPTTTQTTDAAIRGAFNRWRAQTKPKTEAT